MLRRERYSITVPPNVNDYLRLPSVPVGIFGRRYVSTEVVLHIGGPSTDLSTVQLDLPRLSYADNRQSRTLDFKTLAPPTTRFTLSDSNHIVKARNEQEGFVGGSIGISARNKDPRLLVYALLHAISRLNKYQDADYYGKSKAAHHIFREFNKKNISDYSDHLTEINSPYHETTGQDLTQVRDAYDVVRLEEIEVAKDALLLLRRLITEDQINPVSHVTSWKALTAMVNSPQVLRLMDQYRMDRDYFGYALNNGMYLTPNEIKSIMSGFPRNVPVPFR